MLLTLLVVTITSNFVFSQQNSDSTTNAYLRIGARGLFIKNDSINNLFGTNTFIAPSLALEISGKTFGFYIDFSATLGVNKTLDTNVFRNRVSDAKFSLR